MQLTAVTDGNGRLLYNHPLPYLDSGLNDFTRPNLVFNGNSRTPFLAESVHAARCANETQKAGLRLAPTGLLEQRF